MRDLPERLALLAKHLRLEDQALAQAGGVTKETFYSYKKGKAQPRFGVLAHWCEKFGINANWLILGIGGIERLPESSPEAAEEPAPYGGAPPKTQAASPKAEDIRELVAQLRKLGATDKEIKRAVLALVGVKD